MDLDPIIREVERELERRGWEKIDLCRALDISTQRYNNWRKRGVPHSRKADLARIMDWDPYALAFDGQIVPGYWEPDSPPTGNSGAAEFKSVRVTPRVRRVRKGTEGAPFKHPKPMSEGGPNVEPGPPIRGSVPLISWVQAGSWHIAEDPYLPGDGEDFLPCPVSHGPRTYALRVDGDSMTAAWGPSYPEGTIIFVDPDQAGGAENKSLVIAKLNGHVTFKQYVVDGGRQFLRPLNPQYPPLTEEFDIVGKVIGAFYATP